MLCSVTFLDSYEVATGEVVHQDHDKSAIGAFKSPNLDPAVEGKKAKDFRDARMSNRKAATEFQPNIAFSREEVAVQCLPEPNCAVAGLDTGRIRLADAALQYLVQPAMEEIRAAVGVHEIDLPADLVDPMIMMDHITMYSPSSMQVDVRKVCEVSLLLLNVSFLGKLHRVREPRGKADSGKILRRMYWCPH